MKKKVKTKLKAVLFVEEILYQEKLMLLEEKKSYPKSQLFELDKT